MLLGILLATPLVVALTCLLVPRRKVAVYANAIGAGVMLVLGLIIAGRVFANGMQFWFGGFMYFDALNAYILATISIVGFMGCLYSIGYMGKEVDEGVIDAKKFGRYFFWLHLFIFAMLMVVSVNNLGVMWVFVEGTTLATALLVGFYHTKASLEAAWKYIIICSVGITFALFGTILIYFAGTKAMGSVGYALNWSELVRNAVSLDPKLLKLAFVFILVGYGTKAGLVPMHTWLPDAHSQAPSPVSALLSGVLLNCALYGIIRFHILLSQSPVGSGYSSDLLIFFGVLSMGFVVPFILIQHDIKRLLAYSSIEHMGLITLGIGFGSKVAVFGAVFHLFNHALTKSLMFFAAGNVVQKFNTKRISRLKGVINTIPLTGTALVMGTLAITGAPPFALFASEFSIITAGFSQDRVMVTCLVLLFIALVFAGFIYHFSQMAMGSGSGRIKPGEVNLFNAGVLLIPLTAVILLGLYLPPAARTILQQVTSVIGGSN